MFFVIFRLHLGQWNIMALGIFMVMFMAIEGMKTGMMPSSLSALIANNAKVKGTGKY